MPQPYVPFPNVVEAALNFVWRNKPAINVMHFGKITPGITQDNLIELGILVRNWYQSTYQQGQTNDIALNSIKLTDLTTQTSPTFTYTAGLPAVGQTPGNSVLNHTALVLSLSTAARGRSSRGRMYLAGLDAAQVLENYWNANYAALFRESLDGWLGSFTTAGWNFGIASRKANKQWRTVGLFQPVTSVSIKRLLVGTQRGRLD